MDIQKHSNEFKNIIKKYSLDKKEKADEIATFLTKAAQNKVSAKEFAALFSMTEKEAVVFLSFIEKGIKLKDQMKQR